VRGVADPSVSALAQMYPVLLLVDGLNLLWRSAFGFPRRITSRSGVDITAVFGFFALLRKAINEMGVPAECVVCFDGEYGCNERVAIDATYKQNRASTDVSHLAWLPTIKEGLQALHVPWIEMEEHEADDVIASICARTLGRSTIVLSTDRDFFQLVTANIAVLNTARRQGDGLITREQIVDRFSVEPWQWGDFRALMGDPSDGIPGVRGIGPRRAAHFLTDGMSLERLLESGHLTGTWGDAIRVHWNDVLKWRELIRFRDNLDVGIAAGGEAVELPRPAEIIGLLGLWNPGEAGVSA